jgi:NTE family protein
VSTHLSPPADLALVIGSGGIKPVAAIPLFEFLEAEGVRARLVAGSSGGAILACLYATGMPAREIRALLSRTLRSRLFWDLDVKGCLAAFGLAFLAPEPWRALIKPNAILRMYRDVFGDMRLEDFAVPVRLQATDLLTGEGVTLSTGPVVDALYASTAVLPLLPPIETGGRLLADGAFSDSLPLAAVAPDDPALLLAVSSAERSIRACAPPPFFTVPPMDRERPAWRLRRRYRNLFMLRVRIGHTIHCWQTKHVPDILRAGELAVARRRNGLRAALAGLDAASMRVSEFA